jgi:predicted transposase YdaD
LDQGHLLGRGKTLEQAITELLAMPSGDNRRSQTLKLLTNWRVSLQLKNPQEEVERELMATLSQAYLDWEQQTKQRGEQRGRELGQQEGAQREAIALILRQLNRRLRLQSLPESLLSQVQQLSLPQLENLSEALLDFQTLADLERWLGK